MKESVLRKLLREKNAKTPAHATEEMTVEERFRALPKAACLTVDTTLLEDQSYLGSIFGNHNDEACEYFQHGTDKFNPAKLPKLGEIVSAEEYRTLMEDPSITREGCVIFGACIDKRWQFHLFDESRRKMDLVPYQLVKELGSRSVGLLDTTAMMGKTAIIVGAGSVGGHVAMELANHCVGRFVLIDRDLFKVVNLTRHELDLSHVTAYKVDALKDRILKKNPYAQVEVFRGWLQDIPFDMVADIKDGIVISTADHHGTNADAAELAEMLGLPYVNIGCWENAHAGATYHWLPDSGKTVYANVIPDVIQRERLNPPQTYDYYLDPNENTRPRQMGLSANIRFITDSGILKALDVMNLNTEGFIPQVLHDQNPYTVTVVTNRPELGGETAAIWPATLTSINNIEIAGDVKADA